MLSARVNGGIGKFAPGSGRLIDLTWPLALMQQFPANAQTPTSIQATALDFFGRANGEIPRINSTSTLNSGVGATELSGGGAYGNRPALVYRPGTGGGITGIHRQLDAFTINPTYGDGGNLSAQGDIDGDDDFACFRWLAWLYFPGVQKSYTGDTGFLVCTDNVNNRDISGGNCGGFGFSQTGNAEISLVRRNGEAGAYTKTPLVGLTKARWNKYEFRMIGANAARNAKLKAFVNGSLVASLDWVVDGLTNTQSHNGAFGLFSVIAAHGPGAGNGDGVAIHKARFMAGPTEESLL